MGAINRSGVRNSKESKINNRRPGLLRIDQGSISSGKKLQGKKLKTRGRVDNKIPVMKAADQGPGN